MDGTTLGAATQGCPRCRSPGRGEAVDRVVEAARVGIDTLSLYAFSPRIGEAKSEVGAIRRCAAIC